jgi:hypothetical protein
MEMEDRGGSGSGTKKRGGYSQIAQSPDDADHHDVEGGGGGGGGSGTACGIDDDASGKRAKLAASSMITSGGNMDMTTIVVTQTNLTRFVRKLYSIVLLVFLGSGAIMVWLFVSERFAAFETVNAFMQTVGVGSYALLLLLLVAFRNDSPLNLGVLLLVLFFVGFLMGFVTCAEIRRIHDYIK